MTRAPRLLLTITLLGLAATAKHSTSIQNDPRRNPSMIQGADDRQETVDVDDPEIRALADSVPALVSQHRLFVPLRQRRPLRPQYEAFEIDGHPICPEERFATQPRFAKCSGALVAPDLVLTAGHCVDDLMDCVSTSVVFGYRLGRDRRVLPIDRSEAYHCKRIVARKYDADNDADFALIRLDRPVRNHRPLPVSRSFAMPPFRGTRVMTIGYPSGFPQKVTRGGIVLGGSGEFTFFHTLDTFQANSGAPVFEEESGKIIGIHVRGNSGSEEDEHANYRLAPGLGCLVPRACPDGCLEHPGEASVFHPLFSLIPESPAASPR